MSHPIRLIAFTMFALPLGLQLGISRLSAAEPFANNVFVSGSEGYHTYRIPSLIVSKRGTVLAFCEGRKTKRSDHGDLDLMLRRSHDNGSTWEKMQLVYEEGGDKQITIGNPCPVVDAATGTIWLTFCRDNRDVLVTHSSDDGVTWSKPVDITRHVNKPEWGWVATGPGVGIQLRRGLHKGRLVIPCDHGRQIDDKRVMFSHVFYSDDRGKTWKLGGTLDRHTDECQVVELTDGRLMLNMRNYWGHNGMRPDRGNMRAVSTSSDGGETWSGLIFDKTLIESICQASFLRYSTGETGGRNRILFLNPASKTTRHRLTVRLSYDEGKHWPVAKLLHPGPSAYSCLTVLPDGSVGCLYEGGGQSAYEKIIFARFSIGWLTGGKDSAASGR